MSCHDHHSQVMYDDRRRRHNNVLPFSIMIISRSSSGKKSYVMHIMLYVFVYLNIIYFPLQSEFFLEYSCVTCAKINENENGVIYNCLLVCLPGHNSHSRHQNHIIVSIIKKRSTAALHPDHLLFSYVL